MIKYVNLNAILSATMLSMLVACSTSPSSPSSAESSTTPVEQSAEVEAEVEVTIPEGAQALISAYPDFIKGYEDNEIIFTDGSRMVYDDGRKKDFATMLDDSDLEDMFYTAYAAGGKPKYLADAGRSRSEVLFKKMYGSSEGNVRSHLVDVPWLNGKVKFTSVNGAADSLAAVNKELASHPELCKYLDSSGTFYWRNVRGANRLSAHSYGIAFDIAVPHSSYWLWDHKGAAETDTISYSNKIPLELVKIFEKHGFIWGGAWYHYDTMHFEYRPEILAFARLANDK